jgi:hypothetical protein
MEHPDVVLARLSAKGRGAFTHDEAIAAGLTDAMLTYRRASGVIIAEHDATYRHAAVPMTQDLRWRLALKACGPDSFLSRRSAAVVHGWDGVRSVRPDVTTPHMDRPRVEGINEHRTRRFHPNDVRVLEGMRVASRGRTALEICSVLPGHLASEVITDAVIAKRLSVTDIAVTLDRTGGRGMTGTRALRLIGDGLDVEGLQSKLELLVARILDTSTIPRMERQHELVCSDGREVRLDLARPELKIAVEADGHRWHATPARLKESRARSRSIQQSGWLHLVYGWSDATETPHVIRREVETAHAERSTFGIAA